MPQLSEKTDHSSLIHRKLWDHSNLDPRDLIVQVDHVAEMTDAQVARIYDLFNEFGVLIVEHAPAEMTVEELHALGSYFGKPVKHDRGDERGLVVIAELQDHPEFVGASAGPHLFHTGGSFMPWDQVPKVVLLQCETQSRIGGRSIVSSGAAAFAHLLDHDPEALSMLCDPEVFSVVRSAAGIGAFGNTGGSRKAVFDCDRLGDGRVWLTFRFDGQVSLDLRPESACDAFDSLLNFFNRSENQIDFRLEPNQVLVADNTSVVHARTAYQAGSGRKLNRLQLDGNREELVFGFAAPGLV